MTYKIGDRVEIYGYDSQWSGGWDGPGTVTAVYTDGANILPDEWPSRLTPSDGPGFFIWSFVRPLDESYKPTDVPPDTSKWEFPYDREAISQPLGDDYIRGTWLIIQLCAFASNGIVWRTNSEHDVVTITVSREAAERLSHGYCTYPALKAAREALS